jgi:hypothetical protein
MRSKTMTIMAAAVLFLPTIAHAQPSEGRGIYQRDDLKNARDDVGANRNVRDSSSNAAPTGWTFAVLTFRKYTRRSTIKREPYGVFTSRDECDIARAKKIAFLDNGDYRQPHLLPDAPVITTTTTTATAVSAKSITTEQPGGPTERMDVTDCAAENFSAGSSLTAQKN